MLYDEQLCPFFARAEEAMKADRWADATAKMQVCGFLRAVFASPRVTAAIVRRGTDVEPTPLGSPTCDRAERRCSLITPTSVRWVSAKGSWRAMP
jgi:hypothetical protein